MSRMLKICLSAALLASAVASGQAAVTTIGIWRLGEDDAGAANGGTTNASTAGIAGGGNLARAGDAVYSSLTTAPGSAMSMQFSGNDAYSAATPSSLTDNVGIEIWVRATSLDAFDFVVANGRVGNGGYGIVQQGGVWGIIHSGVSASFGGPAVQLNTWTHLAFVRDGGVSTLYWNSLPTTAALGTVPTAPDTFVVGANQLGAGVLEGQFNGFVDHVRLFSFAPGQFSPSDLNFPAVVPEPSSVLLAGLAGLGLIRRRRN